MSARKRRKPKASPGAGPPPAPERVLERPTKRDSVEDPLRDWPEDEELNAGRWVAERDADDMQRD